MTRGLAKQASGAAHALDSARSKATLAADGAIRVDRSTLKAAVAIQRRMRGKDDRSRVNLVADRMRAKKDMWHRVANGQATAAEVEAATTIQRNVRGWGKRNDLYFLFKQLKRAEATQQKQKGGGDGGGPGPQPGKRERSRSSGGCPFTSASHLHKHIGTLRKPSLGSVGQHATKDREALLLKAAEEGDSQTVVDLCDSGGALPSPSYHREACCQALTWPRTQLCSHPSHLRLLLPPYSLLPLCRAPLSPHAGVNLNTQDGMGKTPLMRAADANHTTTALLLLRRAVRAPLPRHTPSHPRFAQQQRRSHTPALPSPSPHPPTHPTPNPQPPTCAGTRTTGRARRDQGQRGPLVALLLHPALQHRLDARADHGHLRPRRQHLHRDRAGHEPPRGD